MKIIEVPIQKPEDISSVINYSANNFKLMASIIEKQDKTIKNLERSLTVLSLLGVAYVFITERRMEEVRNIKMQDAKNVLQMDNIEEQLYSVSDRVSILEIFNNKNGEKVNNKEG